MAIKGKGKSRRRGVAAGPKPVYVTPKKPLLARKGLWLGVGITLAVAIVASVVSALLVKHHDNQVKAEKAAEAAIVRNFGTQLDNALTPVGQGASLSSFQALPDLSQFVKEFGKGNVSAKITEKKADSFDSEAAAALAAVQKVNGQAMVGTHTDKLQDLVNGQTLIENGLQAYQQVAESLKIAAQSSGSQQKELVAHTTALLTLADTVFQEGYNDLVGLRATYGIVPFTSPSAGTQPPPGTVPTP